MTRTRPLTLVVATVLGVAVGFLLDQVLTAAGRATFVPAVTMPILLVLLAIVVIVLAVPVRRASRGGRSVDPFRALRIAMLAKASSIVGAALGGFALGLWVFLLTRPVEPPVGSIASVIATAVCGAILVVAALVAEKMCTIRKKDDDDAPPERGAGAD